MGVGLCRIDRFFASFYRGCIAGSSFIFSQKPIQLAGIEIPFEDNAVAVNEEAGGDGGQFIEQDDVGVHAVEVADVVGPDEAVVFDGAHPSVSVFIKGDTEYLEAVAIFKGGIFVLVVGPDDERVLETARPAPTGPKVNEYHFAPQVGELAVEAVGVVEVNVGGDIAGPQADFAFFFAGRLQQRTGGEETNGGEEEGIKDGIFHGDKFWQVFI